jgi:hypothetical protein
MRWLSIFWVTVLVLATVTAAGAADVDGFRGIKWGTALAALNGAEFTKIPPFQGIAPDMETYQRTGEDLIVAGLKVDRIYYNFRKGKLVSVNIDFKGYFSYERLAAYCQKLFGFPTASMAKSMEYISTYENVKTGALLYLQLSTPLYSDGRLFFYSREMFD